MSQPESISDVIETRRRSRSKTPMMNLRVSSDRENGESSPAGNRKVRKTPTVGAIDESDEQPSAQKSLAAAGVGQPRSTAVRKARIVTSDYSSDDVSPDRVQKAMAVVQKIQKSGQLSQSAVTTTTTQVTKTFESKTVLVQGQGFDQQQNVVSVKTSSAGNSSADKESTVAKQATTESPKKATSSPSKPTPQTGGTKQQEEVVSVATSKKTSTTVEASRQVGGIRTSTPKNAQTFKSVTAKIVLTPEELQKHAAYKEYLEAGEYWNKYPKTDYTYSELSPHRREVAPGLVAMPNMSRPSLNKHAERVQTMIERNPTQEAFIRQRYTSARSGGMFVRSDPYDSTEEIDSYLREGSQRHQRQTIVNQQQSIVSRFFLSIVTFFFTCFDSVRSVFRRRDEEHQYYTRIEDERGFFARAYGLVSSFFINVFKRIYLLISSVLFLDAWLLQTSARNVEQQQAGQRKRRFLLFLLVLLPFLLIGGTMLYLDPSALETVRASLPSGLRDLELKLPNLPAMPEMPNVPELPDVETVKQYVGERWTDLSDLNSQYLDQMKLFTQNSLETIRQLWGEGEAEQETSA